MLIQTGDPSGTGKGGRSIYAPTGDRDSPGFFADEINVRARSFARKGLLAMANRGQPNTNHSELAVDVVVCVLLTTTSPPLTFRPVFHYHWRAIDVLE